MFLTASRGGAIRLAVGMLLAISADAGGQARAHQCGVDRWAVKIMADPDRARIDTAVIATSIPKLAAVLVPDVPYPPNARLAPHEFRTYQIRARVRQIVVEDDGDWHVILEGIAPDSGTMIAEIPDSTCAFTAEDGLLYSGVRATLRRVPRGGEIVVTGIGFFDFIHAQRGRAPNGFELHPVIRIQAVAPIQRSGRHLFDHR